VRKLLFEGARQLLGQFELDELKKWNMPWISMSNSLCRLSGAKVMALIDPNDVSNSIDAISSLVADLDWEVFTLLILDGR
jgi:hypothetical protein